MYRRRFNPYSRIEQFENSRRIFWEVLILALALGLLINLLSSMIGLVADALLAGHPARPWLALALMGGLIALTLLVFARRFLNHSQTARIRLEVAIPYLVNAGNGLQVARQHPFRPVYRAAEDARRWFARAFPPNQPAARDLAARWKATEPPMFQRFIAPYHRDLVDALLLQLLHRYGEESLGPEARYGWHHVAMPSHQLGWDDLPPPLHDNPFVLGERDKSPDWQLTLPAEVTLFHERGDDGRRWRLGHAKCGEAVIQFIERERVAHSPKSMPVAILGEGETQKDALWVVGTRFTATAAFRRVLFAETDPFQQWATQLLAFIEEGLDWNFFLEQRPAQITRDLAWKIGDLPSTSDSLWARLKQIDERLARIEQQEEA